VLPHEKKTKTRDVRHYSYYLEDGMDILELGAAEESYLPENIKLNRLVGVGLSPELMEQNPSLTEKLVINLNKVEPDVGVEELERLGSDTFDAILMANTIDFLTDPKEVFRQVRARFLVMFSQHVSNVPPSLNLTSLI
jgi:hypothetical protein